ncbi:ABC transporter ATP-binding protein [Micrococcus luteus]|uniref:ABC transporter ATP-binding protein n=1 Tax=Micrococcus luteus TaxID=1270 RepID=UPI0015D76F7E|nr:ABC transporter ATP-binding protein [Micrococcus luteus]
MIRRLFAVHDSLLPGRGRAWLILAVIGSFLLGLLDMAGIAAMVPLMLVATNAPGATRVLDILAGFGVQGPTASIVTLAALVGGAFLVKTVFALVFRWWLLGRTTALEAEASANLIDLFARSPYSVHRERSVADVHRQIDASVPSTFSGLLNGLLMILVDALTLLLAAVMLVIVSPVGAFAAVVCLGGTVLLSQALLRPHQQRLGHRQSELAMGQWSSRGPISEGFRDVRLTDSSDVFVERYRRNRRHAARVRRLLSLMSEAPRYVLEVAMVVSIGVIAGAIALLGDPAETITVLGVFVAAAGRMLPTLNRLGANLGIVRSSLAGLEELERTLETIPEEGRMPRRRSADEYAGDIVFSEVSYRFPGTEEWALQDLSFTVPHGSSIALVGPSGAGKSTALDLMLGLIEPTSGTISCGGREIAADPAAWVDVLGVVSQEVYIINATLRENVAFGVPPEEIDDAQVERALASAQLTAVVAALPEGLDTEMGERGVRLSGGQRQRIGIARALYRQPKILVLDEATSALDNVTERDFMETVDALAGRLTIVMVAHRLSTVRNADHLMFLQDGRSVAEGTFEEVTAANRDFARLVELGRLQ